LFLSTPQDIFLEIVRLFSSGEIFPDIFSTLYRTFLGFGIACLIGIPLGLLMGYSNRIYSSLEFTVEFFRGIPATALFPLFLLLFGIGDNSKNSDYCMDCVASVNYQFNVWGSCK